MSKRKGYNPMKRKSARARALLKKLNAVVIWVAGQNDNSCLLIDIKTGEEIPVGRELLVTVGEFQHKWSILCAVMGRRQDGEEYMQSRQVDAPRCYQSKIAGELSEIHTKLLREMNPAHRVGLAWIACPWGADIDDELAERLFSKFGAWSAERIAIEDAA